MGNIVNIAVIGAGSISSMHLDAYVRNADVRVQAICDVNEARAADKAKVYGIPKVYTDYRHLFDDPSVDAISICTWNYNHAELAIAALEAGKHVLVEKPLCMTVAEALQIEETVRRTQKVLQVGFIRRYGNFTSVLKTFLDAGELGEIYYAKASYLRRHGNPSGWFSNKARSGGGPLIDLGVHMIDICWYLMGRPKLKSVSGNVYRKLGNRANVKHLSSYVSSDPNAYNDVEDLANALLRFENGASLMVDVSFTLHARQDEISVKLYGDKGGAEIEPEFWIVSEKHDTILNITPQLSKQTFDFIEAAQNEIDHFVSCCQTGETPNSSVSDGVEIMKMLCGIYESAETGAEIYFN